MPNKNYLKGVRKERAIVNEARAKGLIAFRSAGSHSKVDVVIINLLLRRIEFIQCKPNDFSDKKTQELLNELKELNGVFEVSFNVV